MLRLPMVRVAAVSASILLVDAFAILIVRVEVALCPVMVVALIPAMNVCSPVQVFAEEVETPPLLPPQPEQLPTVSAPDIFALAAVR